MQAQACGKFGHPDRLLRLRDDLQRAQPARQGLRRSRGRYRRPVFLRLHNLEPFVKVNSI